MSRPIAIASLAAVLSATALGAEKPRVLVVPFVAGNGASESAASRFTTLVGDELKTRGDALEVIAAPATRAPAADKPASSSTKRGPSAEATSALDAGRKAFDDLRFDDAVAGFKKGISAMLADPATADYEAVTDAYVKLAAAYFRKGEEKDAKATLLDLARFSPSYALPPGYPPVFQREFEKAKKRLDKQPKGQVSIEGPAGATAFLDGRDLGMVPVLEENVPAGPHYVKVEGGKGDRFGQVIDMKGALVKVKATFSAGGGASERAPVTGPVDPKLSSVIDDATAQRLSGYLKSTNADYALVGYVYKTGDTQLTCGSALYSVKKNAFASLDAVAFDTDVLTANTEAFKLADGVVLKLSSFGASASLPLNLASKSARTGTSGVAVAAVSKSTDPEDVEAATPKSRPVLTPTEKPVEDGPVVDINEHVAEKPPEVKKSGGGVPTWVWVVTGVAVAAGAGVGGYFAISAATKPVTGTVTATW
ncbi:MAG: hypothetical protein AB1938_15870 [Myxococcota bacterium]